MNLRQIKALINIAIEKDIAELEFEKGDEKLRIRRFPRGGPSDNPNSPPYVVVASAPPSIAEAVQPPPVAPPSKPAPPSPRSVHRRIGRAGGRSGYGNGPYCGDFL